jgi:hypothetical protein
MITRPEKLQAAPELETTKIAQASDEEARNFVSRAMRERWLSTVVRCLNRLEQKPTSRNLARRALQRLGFPTN